MDNKFIINPDGTLEKPKDEKTITDSDWKLMNLPIDNSKEAAIHSTVWKDPKEKLYNEIGYKMNALILGREAYLVFPKDAFKMFPRATGMYRCKYPHHRIKDGKLVVDIKGLQAAFQRAKQQGEYKGEIKEHINRHYKELGLVSDAIIESNDFDLYLSEITDFSFMEDYLDEYLTESYLKEKSHGLLKSSFRMGIDISNGHNIKIVFDLNTNDIDDVGSHVFGTNRNRSTGAEKEIKNINKTGHGDFTSKGTVKAIIDTDSKKSLRECEIIGSLSGSLGYILYYTSHDELIAKFPGIRLFDDFAYNSLEVREFISKTQKWKNDTKKYSKKFIVGDKETESSYKSTRAAKNFRELQQFTDIAIRRPGWNLRGIQKTEKDLKRDLTKRYNEFSILRNTAIKHSKVVDKVSFNGFPKDYPTMDIITALSQDFIYNHKIAEEQIEEKLISRALTFERNLIKLINQIKDLVKVLKSYKSKNESVFTGTEEFNEKLYDNNIRGINRRDLTNGHFSEWFFKLKDFYDIKPEEFNYEMLINKPDEYQYAYGFFDNKLEGIVQVVYLKRLERYHINMLYVNTDMQNKGIGQRLLNFVISRFGHSELSIDSVVSNTRAIHVYEKLGFEIIATVPDEVSDEDHYLMIRKPTQEFNEMIADSVLEMLPSTFPLNNRKEEEKTINDFLKGTQKNEIDKRKKKLIPGYIFANDSILESYSESKNSPPEIKAIDDEDPGLSEPKKIDKKESDANGIVRKQLYIAFIEYSKNINNRNTFGSVFDKDAFELYSYVPHELRYFYRLANPLLCVLENDLTFFALSELKTINRSHEALSKSYIIFASDKNGNVKLFQYSDKKVYAGIISGNTVKIGNEEAPTFDEYIQKLVGRDFLGTGLIKDEDNKGKDDKNAISDEDRDVNPDDRRGEETVSENEEDEKKDSSGPEKSKPVPTSPKSTVVQTGIKSTVPEVKNESSLFLDSLFD